MRYLILAIAGAFLLALTACAAPANDADAGPKSTANTHSVSLPEAQEKMSAGDRAACEASGGKVQRAGMIGWEHCVTPFPDAGKVCRDSSECEGQCREGGLAKPGEMTTGKCQADSLPFGCYAEVKNGMSGPALCVD